MIETALPMDEPIAEINLIGIWPDGSRKPIRIQIGKPYLKNEGYACPATLDGLYESLCDLQSSESFSALCLAMGLIRRLLLDFQQKGGKLFFNDENSTFDEDQEIDISLIWDLHGPSAQG